MSDLFVKLDAVGSAETAKEFEVRFKGDRPVRIRTVLVSHVWAIARIDARYDDSAANPDAILQPDGSHTNTFDIPDGDFLVAVEIGHGAQDAGYPTNEVITLQLETARGVKSPVYGGGSGKSIVERHTLRAPEGQHIVGFYGATGGPQDLPLRLGVYTAPRVIVDPKPVEPVADDGDIWTSPVLNVSDVPASVRWFEALGWKRLSTMNMGGLIAGAADSNDAGPAFFATIRAGYGQIFLCQYGQGLRGGTPAAPGSGDDVGATWQVWWLKTRAGVDAIHQRAVAAGVTIISPPEDKPWGEVEMRIAHPEGHVFRVSAPITAPGGGGDPQPETKQPEEKQPEEKQPEEKQPPPRPVGRFNLLTKDWKIVLTLGAEGQPSFINYGYNHPSHTREQIDDVQWNADTRTLTFKRYGHRLAKAPLDQTYTLTFQDDGSFTGSFSGTGGGAPLSGNRRTETDDIPTPDGTWDLWTNLRTWHGVLQISGGDPNNLSGVINFGPYHNGFAPEQLSDVKWDAQNHTLSFRRTTGSQDYILTFRDQGRAFYGGFIYTTDSWSDVEGTKR